MKEITLGQFQEIYALQKSELSDEDKMTEMVAIISGKSTKEVEEMLLPDFNKLASEVTTYLSNPLPEAKPKRIMAGVGILYEPAKMNRGQCITINHFISKDVIANAHYILAALSYDLKTKKNEPGKHEEIAENIKDVPMSEAVASCLFFCQLYNVSMLSLQNYLEGAMMMKGMNLTIAKKQLTDLMTASAGYIMPKG